MSYVRNANQFFFNEVYPYLAAPVLFPLQFLEHSCIDRPCFSLLISPLLLIEFCIALPISISLFAIAVPAHIFALGLSKFADTCEPAEERNKSQREECTVRIFGPFSF